MPETNLGQKPVMKFMSPSVAQVNGQNFYLGHDKSQLLVDLIGLARQKIPPRVSHQEVMDLAMKYRMGGTANEVTYQRFGSTRLFIPIPVGQASSATGRGKKRLFDFELGVQISGWENLNLLSTY